MTRKDIPDFEPRWDLPKTPLKSAYIVCTTPRTGSNLLCFALAEQGIGTPLEYLNLLGNGSTQNFYSRITDSSFQTDIQTGVTGAEMCAKYIPEIVNNRTTTNGFFGMKVFAHHFTNLFGSADLSVLTPLIGCEPKLIHLVRENLVELTVSFIVARNNQHWHSEMVSEESRKTVYNFNKFFETMLDLSNVQNKWSAIFKKHINNDVLRITYKQLSEHYIETMTRVNAYLGVTDVEIPQPPIKRQLSEEKLELIQQFTRDCRRNAKLVRSALQKVKYR